MGLATARAFAHAGTAVTWRTSATTACRKRWTRSSPPALERNAMGVLCAVSDESQVAAMVERTVAAFGGLDAAFNNADSGSIPTC